MGSRETDNDSFESIVMHPIGYIKSPYSKPSDVPRGRDCKETPAQIVLLEKYLEGAADIHVGDSLMVLFYFHRSPGAELTVHIKGDGPLTGVFSTHAPTRPNGIGVTTVTVTGKEGCVLDIIGADMLDGTPLLDIKAAV